MSRTSSTPEQRCLHPIAGPTVRADGEGGALSSDCGGLLRRGSERQLGRTARLAAASWTRHPSSRNSPCAPSGPNGSRSALPLGCQQPPSRSALEAGRNAPPPGSSAGPGACAALLAACTPRGPSGSLAAARGLGGPLRRQLPGAACGPWARPRSPGRSAHGSQACAFYTHSYPHACSGPMWICAGLSGAFVTAGLRPGTRPPGTEQALLFGRRLACLRRPWPRPPLLVRGAPPWRPPGGERGARPSAPERCGLRPGQPSGLATPRRPCQAGRAASAPAAACPRPGLARAPSRQQPSLGRGCLVHIQ